MRFPSCGSAARTLGVSLLLLGVAGCLSATRQRSSRDVGGDESATDVRTEALDDVMLETLPDLPTDTSAETPADTIPDVTPDSPADLPGDLGPDACPELPCSPGDYPGLHPGPCQRLAWNPSTCGCDIVPVAEPTACDDANPCTLDDACHDGACVSSTVDPQCECEPTADTCEAEYGDDDACTGTLRCVGGLCITDSATVPAPCPTTGLAPCQRRACVPATGLCEVSQAANGDACSDGDACTLSDTCQGGQCQTGALHDCDDGDPCTADACVPSSGACSHHLVPTATPEVCNGVDDNCDGQTDEVVDHLCPDIDCDGSTDEPACDGVANVCVGGTCTFSCLNDGGCPRTEVCVPADDGLGKCVTSCVAACPAGLGYRSYDGCHCRVPPTGADKCRIPGGWAVCEALSPGEDGYGQDGTFGGEHLQFTDLTDGRVRDDLTGVEWGTAMLPESLSLASAQAACQANAVGLPGAGWSLPALYAMFAVVDFSVNAAPFWSQAVFGDHGGWVTWTSTPAFKGGGTPFMYVDFSKAEVVLSDSANKLDARCAKLPTPSPPSADEFVTTREGHVVDRVTGLAWRNWNSCAQCTWYEALRECLALGPGWRLPNAKEALSLTDYRKGKSSVLPEAYSTAGLAYDVYWTSTPLPNGRATTLDYGIGYLQSQDTAEKAAARCVRDAH